jgi:Mrp family chromosome partitioning ATPase
MTNQVVEDISLAKQANEISHVIGIMSGKGGVGKSLMTGLLAVALKKAGYSVGILDADITGPSIPKMFGLTDRPEVNELGIFPVETKCGIRVISINLLLDSPDSAVIWRGPMISNTVQQFWTEVIWGKLDYLLVDLPPGTSDVPLTVMQSLPLDGVVIVTSPQDLAAMVVRKAVKMCTQMTVPILGMVLNMAYLKCPGCGDVLYPFGNTNGQKIADQMGIPYLLDMPIDPEISARSDSGTIEEYAANPLIGKVDLITNGLMAVEHAHKCGGCSAGECTC